MLTEKRSVDLVKVWSQLRKTKAFRVKGATKSGGDLSQPVTSSEYCNCALKELPVFGHVN